MVPPDERGYVTGGLRAYSLSHSDKVNRRSAKLMRAQNPLSTRQPACDHRRVLGGRALKF